MGATAKVDEVALFIHRNLTFEVGDVFHLIMVVFEHFAGFLRGNLFSFEGNGFFRNLLHFRFDGGEILLGDDAIAEVDVVVEAFVDGGAKAE